MKMIPTQSIAIKGEKPEAREKEKGEENKMNKFILMTPLWQNLEICNSFKNSKSKLIFRRIKNHCKITHRNLAQS